MRKNEHVIHIAERCGYFQSWHGTWELLWCGENPLTADELRALAAELDRRNNVRKPKPTKPKPAYKHVKEAL